MASGYLELRFRDDGDGTGFLSAEARHGKFSGASEACVSVDHLLEFAGQLHQFPLKTRPSVVGGFWSSEEPNRLEQELVGLAVSATDSRGGVAIHVRTATPLWDDDRPESQHSVVLELPVQYEDLPRFGRAVADLVHGKRPLARIEAREAV